MIAVRNALRLGCRLSAVPRRGCAGASIPVDDVVNGLTDDQIQVRDRAAQSAFLWTDKRLVVKKTKQNN